MIKPHLWPWIEFFSGGQESWHLSWFSNNHSLPRGLLCPWDSPGKNTRVGCHILLQEIIPSQGSNPGLLHCRQILYPLSHTHIYIYQYKYIWASPVAQLVKNLPAMWETWVLSLGWEVHLEKGKATYSSILA